jgi:hypothetical protein
MSASCIPRRHTVCVNHFSISSISVCCCVLLVFGSLPCHSVCCGAGRGEVRAVCTAHPHSVGTWLFSSHLSVLVRGPLRIEVRLTWDAGTDVGVGAGRMLVLVGAGSLLSCPVFPSEVQTS